MHGIEVIIQYSQSVQKINQLWSALHRRKPQEKYSPTTSDEKSPPPTISSSVQYTKQDDDITYGNILGESLNNTLLVHLSTHRSNLISIALTSVTRLSFFP